jgi:hypothetical protein
MHLHGLETLLADIVTTLWKGIVAIWKWREKKTHFSSFADAGAQRRELAWATFVAIIATAVLLSGVGLLFMGCGGALIGCSHGTNDDIGN